MTLAARTFDAAGAPIAANVTWESGDPARLSIAGNVATALAAGTTTITARSGSVASSAVPVRVAAPASSEGLINAALAAGTIDAATALKYRVFAIYGDNRLPFDYLGNQTPRRENHLAFDLALAYPTLSAADQAELGPYMLPPIYVDSWLGKRRAAARGASAVAPQHATRHVAGTGKTASPSGSNGAQVRRQADRAPSCSGIVDQGWTPVDSTHFRVWYDAVNHPGDLAGAQVASSVAEETYSALNALGMRAPLSDVSLLSPCFGGDGRIDIYLVPEAARFGISSTVLGATFTINTTAATSSAFINLNRTEIGSPLFFGTVAHEYMHVVQAAYPNHLRMPAAARQFIKDSTADWAIDYVRATDNGEHDSARYLTENIETPLWASSYELKRYGAYLFFQFVARIQDQSGNGYGGAQAIRTIWENIAAQTGGIEVDVLAAINAALPRGLERTFNDFSVQLLNRAPVDRFFAVDGLAARGRFDRDAEVVLATPVIESPVSGGSAVQIPELSSRNERFRFVDPNVTTVTFFNGYTFGLRNYELSLRSFMYAPPLDITAGTTPMAVRPTAQERGTSRRLTALFRVGDQWTVEDWTDTPIRYFCRERVAERIEELVLIYSNGGFSNVRVASLEKNGALGALKLDDPTGLASRLMTSAAPCHQFRGSASGRATVTSGANNFTVGTNYSGVLRGIPADVRGTLGGRQIFAQPGVAFTTNTGSLSATLNGVVAGCRAQAFNETSATTALPSADQDPSFTLYTNFNPGSSANGAYGGGGARSFFALDGTVCTTGAVLNTPAPPAFNMDVLWSQPVADSFFRVDLANRRLREVDRDGTTAFTGSFAAPVITRSSWCFVANRENQPPTSSCP
ncbi:MAG: hypothetical protein MUC68_00530 [Burkholderiaceae bacterium]|nr:hypothetical protein [Burkholderiaceae bacterium]